MLLRRDRYLTCLSLATPPPPPLHTKTNKYTDFQFQIFLPKLEEDILVIHDIFSSRP